MRDLWTPGERVEKNALEDPKGHTCLFQDISWSILLLGKEYKKAYLPFCLSVLFTLLEILNHR